MNNIVIFTIIGTLLLFPTQYSVAAPIDELLNNRIVPIEQICGKVNSFFEFTCDWKCGVLNNIDYRIMNDKREILSSGSFEQDLTIPIEDFPNGEHIEFSKDGFQNNELNLCEEQFSNVNVVEKDFTTGWGGDNYKETPTQTFSEMQEQERLRLEKAEQERIRAETPYTYAEIYAIADNARLDCNNKYGGNQFAWNDCFNNVNTWELNQLDRTDYYGEPQIESQRESSGGGCLIATATYGSEMALEVQQLRELRDNTLLNTESGTSFMGMFNDVYYSFSPYIADMQRENPIFKEMVKLAITPMISSLSILNYVDMDSESEVLGYGISLILLNVGMYVGIPAIVIMRIRK